jgi:glycosyltransferase involved in cell wall biosynthesis
MTPDVTVVMSVYNGQRFLGEAIESILSQTCRAIEFIVIDDGSTDETAAIIASYRDPRIRVVRHARNAGLAASLNEGFALAAGRYIARMDADDVSRPERLASQVRFMDAQPSIGASGTWVEVAGEGIRQRWEYPSTHDAIHARLVFDCSMAHPTVMFNRTCLQKARLSYDSAYPYAQDYELWCRAVHGLTLANIPEVLLTRRLHASQVGRRDANAQQVWSEKIRRRQLEQIGLSPSAEQIALHEAISTWSWPRTEGWIREAEDWLCALRQANRTRALYPEPEFSAVIGERWLAICQSVQGTLGSRFWRSSLSDALDLGWKDNFRGRAWRGLARLGL